MDGTGRDPYSMAVKLYCTVTARAALTCDYTMGTNFHNHNCNCTVNARIRVGPLNVPRAVILLCQCHLWFALANSAPSAANIINIFWLSQGYESQRGSTRTLGRKLPQRHPANIAGKRTMKRKASMAHLRLRSCCELSMATGFNHTVPSTVMV